MKNERIKSTLTEAIYETDGLLTDFEAEVISCENMVLENGEQAYAVVLNRTAFFPEGGGQQADCGTINGIKVCDVKKSEDGTIFHYIESPIPKGTLVKGVVDRKLRITRMQNHGAEHLLCGLINKEFGYENVGFHMTDECVTFDVDGPLSDEDIARIEEKANEVIYENVPITISFPKEEEARKLDYRSKLDTYSDIRLVTIEGYDVCACCAPQLNSTGQIGVIKIIDAMPHRQGMRMTMVAGLLAYMDYNSLCDSNKKIMALLSSKRQLTAEFTKEFVNKNRQLKDENDSLKREMSKIITDSVVEGIKARAKEDLSPEVIFTSVLDNVGLRNLINSCTEIFGGIVAGFIGDDETGYRYICGCQGSVDLKSLAKGLNEKFDGKGGGNNLMIQGSIAGTKKEIEEFFEEKCY